MTNTELEQTLLAILADGAEHSERELVERLPAEPAALTEAARALRDLGLEPRALPDGGYRLAEPLELLDRKRIAAGLSNDARARLSRLEVYPLLDSTNAYLLAGAAEEWPGGAVCLAERQTAGRGRQGRSWVSPFGAGLFASLLWRFDGQPAALSGLSLAIGIAVARTLRALGVAEVGLKWPNDILWRERKLGGILLESGSSAGALHVVAGIGLNVALPRQEALAIDQPWVDLREILGAEGVSRNRLAALLINELVEILGRFEQGGFAGLAGEWARFDLSVGRRVRLRLPNAAVTGIVRGVDASGALLLESTDGRVNAYLGGEIGLRIEP
ncbi:MAG: bifunctional biotin--[acetyl-CoA-carboxylase] ligase/biotin operon repressor BirA [Candidatus Competibacter sp.]|nr:bifunctional biotin--[acetyl-CoA-carboxylase] ligase/biotin operon repressor BirA [Candidatus Competibacter sp.]MDG4582668.1 bifunctional biotin--[acetyl-CoA-carboxylase] ligase/biotin operon repressor BirA [Candidatus Competibacter sp.]